MVVIDKPRGLTSHDVVARVRRVFPKGTTIGHAGTLDPMATGVLVVAIGQATKLVPYLTAADKEYEATITLGIATDSLDADGRETARAGVPSTWRAALDGALEIERNRIMQDPPIFSAIHAHGARSHELARRGEAVELAARAVAVREIAITKLGEAEISVRLVVSKGYYVRAFARDLAIGVGTVGHLSALRRIRSGAFSITESIELAAMTGAPPKLDLASAARRALPVIMLTDIGAAHASAGRKVPLDDMSAVAAGEHAWMDAEGHLVAVGRIEDGAGCVVRGFTRPPP